MQDILAYRAGLGLSKLPASLNMSNVKTIRTEYFGVCFRAEGKPASELKETSDGESANMNKYALKKPAASSSKFLKHRVVAQRRRVDPCSHPRRWKGRKRRALPLVFEV